ncbi:MAG: PEP-CTERM sorting domain-containing protein [Sedimentisphaerales bacterium]|nr:PEP-CTERM sorting domain-containing protein [Sedimentisphaerales bacterium]
MEGLTGDACSAGAGFRLGNTAKQVPRGSCPGGTQRYLIAFGSWLRNRPGERHLIPVAPGLFAVCNYIIHFFEEIRRIILFAAAVYSQRPGIGLFAALMLLWSADNSFAVPIYEAPQSCIGHIFNNNRPGCRTYGFYAADIPYSQWISCDFKEADNLEWIYRALENRYAFLDETLYKITGGGYSLWPGYYPYRQGLLYHKKYGKPCKIIIYISQDAADPENAFIEHNQSDDISTLSASLYGRDEQRYYPASLQRVSAWNDSQIGVGMETKAVPEPSTFALFGLAAIQILRIRRNGRNFKADN